MSLGFTIAINAFPFLDLLETEVESLVQKVINAGPGDTATVKNAMDATRRRLAQGIEVFVRSLPTTIRNDASLSRAAAYALVGLADERMLHYSSGGLEAWRERLLEYDLYGSALAGQEIVARAEATTQGSHLEESTDTGGQLLAPLYLAVFRSGFEGSLRGDATRLAVLTSSLEQAVGAGRDRHIQIATEAGPGRIGLAPLPTAVTGISLWLVTGFMLWLALPADSLQSAENTARDIRELSQQADKRLN